jgi:hypothetical protein
VLADVLIAKDTKDTKDTKDRPCRTRNNDTDDRSTGCPNTDKDLPSMPAKSEANRRYMRPNEASHAVIGCALKVHSALGPGMLESTIGACLFYELTASSLHVQHQVRLPINGNGDYGENGITQRLRATEI